MKRAYLHWYFLPVCVALCLGTYGGGLSKEVSPSYKKAVRTVSPWEAWEYTEKPTVIHLLWTTHERVIMYDEAFSDQGAIALILLWDVEFNCYVWRARNLGAIKICIESDEMAWLMGPNRSFKIRRIG